LIVTDGFAATFSPNVIMDSVHIFQLKHADPMKKMSFFGVLLFAFQNMVLAQHDFHLNAGGGAYMLRANTGEKTQIAPEFLAGLRYSRTVANGKIGLNADLSYHFMQASRFDSVRLSANINTWVFNEGNNFNHNYHMLNLPLSVQWNTKWFSPVAGAEFYYKISPRISQFITDQSGATVETRRYHVPYHGLSWFAGIEAPLNSRLKVGLRYFHGLTKEQTTSVNNILFATKMRRLEASACYRLR
jgi:hypothetical protein